MNTHVGYTGGPTESPTYEEVYTGKTGHAEAVQLGYNPDEIFSKEPLNVSWNIHNPTVQDQQGVDVGSQDGSGIF